MSSVEVRQLSPALVQEISAAADRLAATAAAGEPIIQAACAAACIEPALAGECRPAEDGRGLLVLRGLAVDDVDIGQTPPHWSHAAGESPTRWDTTVLLLASILGRAFGWEGQQGGRLVHDIVPSWGHESEQTGASSAATLTTHTEDAFHPDRAHLLVLACMRNRDGIGTSVASVRDAQLEPGDLETLRRPTVPILPDDAYAEAQARAADAPAVPTLWDSERGLGLRYDPAYTPLDAADPEYRAAYGRLTEELERVNLRVALGPGDVLVIDNDAVVHGREAFQARYDGTDRWLKRASVHVAGRQRPAAERAEHGYGQRIVDPHTEG